MTQLRLGQTSVDGFAKLVTTLPADAFGSVTRSTLPLIDYWRDTARGLEHLGAQLGVSLADATLTFEHEQAVAAGRGKASYTDLMIVTPAAAVAVEAKYTEPPYPKVRDWLGDQPTENRVSVLGGWLGRIFDVTGQRLAPSDVYELPYQLIHRTASVCCIDRPRRWVVYQLFGAHAEYYVETLDRLRLLLGDGAALGLSVLHTPATQVPGPELTLPAARDAESIRAWMRERPLYSFDGAAK